jgi:choline monooxygenase
VDPTAQGTLLDWMGDFPEHFGPFDLENFEEAGPTRRLEVTANWKLFVENHIDGYHLAHLHKDSMLGINHDGQVNSLYNNHWSIFEPLAIEGVLPEYEKNIPTKLLVAGDAKWHASSVHLLFPNAGIATGAKWFTTVQSIPTGPTTSVIEIRTLLNPYADDEPHLDLAYYPGSSADTDLMAEDQLAIERLQIALGSPLFECGPLAQDYERAVFTFQRSVLSFLD